MQIFVKKNEKWEKISGKRILPERIPGLIKKNLKIDENQNLFRIIMAIVPITIIMPLGFKYVTCVEEGRFIDIYCLANGKSRMHILRIDGKKENPEALRNTIIEAMIEAANNMGLTDRGKKGFVTRLEEKMLPLRDRK